METLQRHMPVAGQDGVDELLKIAWRFEEETFQAATGQVSFCFQQPKFGVWSQRELLLLDEYLS